MLDCCAVLYYAGCGAVLRHRESSPAARVKVGLTALVGSVSNNLKNKTERAKQKEPACHLCPPCSPRVTWDRGGVQGVLKEGDWTGV